MRIVMLIAIDDEETTLDAEMNAEYEASVEYSPEPVGVRSRAGA